MHACMEQTIKSGQFLALDGATISASDSLPPSLTLPFVLPSL